MSFPKVPLEVHHKFVKNALHKWGQLRHTVTQRLVLTWVSGTCHPHVTVFYCNSLLTDLPDWLPPTRPQMAARVMDLKQASLPHVPPENASMAHVAHTAKRSANSLAQRISSPLTSPTSPPFCCCPPPTPSTPHCSQWAFWSPHCMPLCL